MASNRAVLGHAVQTAEEWLASVAREFDTDDRAFVYRVVRAWLHGLRDGLSVEACAHFGAQLPEVLRGIYYEGWEPSEVPAKHDVDAYVRRFAREAQIRPTEVRHVAATVTAAMHRHLSGAQLASALEQLPQQMREMLWVAPDPDQPGAAEVPDRLEERLSRLEEEVRTLAEAMNELVHGLEHVPVEEPTENHVGRAAHRAHRIMLSGHSPTG